MDILVYTSMSQIATWNAWYPPNKNYCVVLVPEPYWLRASAKAAHVIRLQYADWYPLVKAKFYEKWTNGWRLSPSKLRYMHDAPGIWDKIHVTRRTEEIMNRLSCVHTKLTHGYLKLFFETIFETIFKQFYFHKTWYRIYISYIGI